MPRTIRTFLPLAGDPDALLAAFTGDPQRWLPGARREGLEQYHFAVSGGAVTRTVSASIGAPWHNRPSGNRRDGQTCWRSMCWEPVGDDGEPTTVDRFLPSLDGELGLHVAGPDRLTLVLDGRYEPPGGAVGAAADALALGRIARTTVQQVLAEIVARLGAAAMLEPEVPAGV